MSGRIVGICFGLFITLNSSAKIQLEADVDTNIIRLGEQAILSLSIQSDDSSIGVFPFIDTLNRHLEIVDRSKIDTSILENGDFLFRQQISFTGFDTGFFVIQPIPLIFNNDTFKTNPILFIVSDVDIQDGDKIADIKANFEDGMTLWDWILIYKISIIIGVLVLLTIFVAVYFLRRYLKNKSMAIVEKIQPQLSAHIVALNRLVEIESQQLWQNDQLKLYYSSVSDIVRQYIEERYHVDALEKTTDETLLALRIVEPRNEAKETLRQLLVLSDMVKFAKEKPLAEENKLCLSLARNFIESTKKEEVKNDTTDA